MGALEDVTWRSLSGDLWLRARRDAIPISGTFELTPLCNFRCRMCYVRLDADRMSLFGRLHTGAEWLGLARQARELGTYAITLTGGEPLTHPDFEEIYSGLSHMGIMVSLLTNGSLVSNGHLRLFREYPPHRIRVTLYGSSNETYARLCGDPRGFDRVMASIGRLRDEGLPVALSFTETTENVGDFDEVMRIARGLGVPIIVCTDLDRPVRGAVSEAERLRVPEERRRVPPIGTSRACDVDHAVEGAAREGLLRGPFEGCRPYRTYFFVNWNGTMENCGSMSWCRSLPFEVGFEAAWQDMQSKLSELREPEACLSCPDKSFCTACPGKRAAESGRPDAVPERYCAEARRWHATWNRMVSKGGEQHEEELRDS